MNRTVLIVDDEPALRKLFRITLGVEGYTVVEADDGRSALEALDFYQPDLVIQDLILPDMHGSELIGRLRARPAGANIPILAVSGLEPDASIPADRCFGFTQVLVKPVAPSHLVRTVVGYLCGNASEVPERVLSAIA